MTLLGIYREQIFSPGKVREDAAIIEAALGALPLSHYQTHTASPDMLSSVPFKPSCVLSMAQSDQALTILDAWHKNGIRIINSVPAVRNCYRTRLIHLLEDARIPIPPSKIVKTAGAEKAISFAASPRYWLKRGDVHAMEPSDVVAVSSPDELEQALDHFCSRKIEDVLVQEHVNGEVIKFYGVGRGEYLRAYSASSGEQITSEINGFSSLVQQAIEATGLEIYGGDAVLTPEGRVVLIDLNDWPSFACCRRPAAKSIARYVSLTCEGALYGL